MQLQEFNIFCALEVPKKQNPKRKMVKTENTKKKTKKIDKQNETKVKQNKPLL